MLVIALVKGVPARTTRIVTVGGVLKREEMDIVLNPHDTKAIEAADFLKRRVGGKIIALSMGPDSKLSPIMRELYSAEVYGVDEIAILSDRRMAGADTLATSYALSRGVKTVLERHTKPIDELIESIRAANKPDAVEQRAGELYDADLLPNRVFSRLSSVRETIMRSFLAGELSAEQTVANLTIVKTDLAKFIVVSGVKSTDGETGSVGPQVAEGLSELLDFEMPHATYVDDIEIDPQSLSLEAERRIGYLMQRLQMKLPALLTIAPGYRPREPGAGNQPSVRANNYGGKIIRPIKWTAEDIGANPASLGLSGSPTIVGPGVEVGKPPVQKVVGKSVVFIRMVGEVEEDGIEYGPFERGEMADGLPASLQAKLTSSGALATFTIDMLSEELFR